MSKLYAMKRTLLGKMNDTSTFLMTACEYYTDQESTKIKKPCLKKMKARKKSSVPNVPHTTGVVNKGLTCYINVSMQAS